jgi:AraC family transcriptional regulator
MSALQKLRFCSEEAARSPMLRLGRAGRAGTKRSRANWSEIQTRVTQLVTIVDALLAERPLTVMSQAHLEAGGVKLTCATFAPSLRLPEHWHRPASIAVILRGGFDATMDRRLNHHCDPGSTVITPAGQLHENQFCDEVTVALVIEPLDGSPMAHRALQELTQRSELRRDPRIAELARQAADELLQPDNASALACEGLALEVAARLSRLAIAAERTPPTWLDRARELLHAAIEEPLSLDELSQAAGVERTRLLRGFRQHLRKSPAAYLRELRAERAAEMLRRGDLPIVEIAAATGFADQSHLGRVFKRLYGCTPAAWRSRGP